MPLPALLRAWKTASWIRLLSGLTSEPSTLARGVERWISSWADTPASPSLRPASASEPTTPATSGPMSCVCSSDPGPLWDSSRTFVATSASVCEKCSRTWPASGSMRNGICSPRKRRAHLTAASGSSCLPTPTATPYGTGQNGCPGDGREKYWPTPTVGDSRAAGSRNLEGSAVHAGVSLTDAVLHGGSTTPRRLPSPRDHRGPRAATAVDRRQEEQRRSPDLPDVIGGALNPTWVEWLMGWPAGWTACEPVATESFQQWQRAHGAS